MLECKIVSVGFDHVTAGEAISPNTTELIEMIVAPARDEEQTLDRRDARLQKSRGFFRVIADERWLRPEDL